VSAAKIFSPEFISRNFPSWNKSAAKMLAVKAANMSPVKISFMVLNIPQ